MARAYYNEFDPYAAQWLRNLIAAGHIAPGDVDTRSIVDVQPSDLAGYTQCHFFADIGGWSLAARLAGFADDRPLWTGSCPCQPFSVAGKGGAQEDERHLWPVFFDLIRACRPDVVMGEQVAVAAGARPSDPFSLEREIEALAREKSRAFAFLEEGQPNFEPGFWDDLGCEEAREVERAALRFRGASGGVDGPYRVGRLRDDGPTLELERRSSGLGHAVFGPDSAFGRIHDQQRQGYLVWSERDDADVGAGSGRRSGRGGEGEGSREGGELARALVESAGTPSARDWLDGVQSDFQEVAYACGAAIVPGCAVDAPHRRDRLWFVADAAHSGRREERADTGRIGAGDRSEGWPPRRDAGGASDHALCCDPERYDRGDCHPRCPFHVEHAIRSRLEGQRGHGDDRREPGRLDTHAARPASEAGGAVSDAERIGREVAVFDAGSRNAEGQHAEPTGEPRMRGTHWGGAQWAIGADGKARRVEPGIRLLAHGVPSRVGKLRAYGNAIVPQVAAEVIGAYLDAREAA